MIESLLQDIRIGFRVLRKEKSFCFLAVLVLALGICGVTTQFTVVNAFVLRGFSFPHPEQLMSVGLIDPQGTAQNNNFGAGNIPSAQDYLDLRAGQQSFAMMAGYLNGSTINVTYKNNPQRYTGGYVTEDFFRIVGVSPILGRDFTPDDNKPGAEKVTILGHEIWQRDFNGDKSIVGQSVRINGRAATIVGVMPPNFKFPQNEELWVPLYNEFPLKPRGDPAGIGPSIMGRLKPDVTQDQVNAEFITLAKRIAKDNPKTTQAFVNAVSAALAWLAKASTDEIVAAVPPEYYAGDRALYRAMIENNRGRVSHDGRISPEAATITHKNLAAFEDTIKNAKIDVAQTYDNTFIERAPKLRAQ